MLTIDQYKEIAKVKDSSPFTRDCSLNEYIRGVRRRLARWQGVPEESITLEQIFFYLSNNRSQGV